MGVDGIDKADIFDEYFDKGDTKMTEEIIIDECFNCKKKKDIADNWRNCKLKCSYKYKRRENDEITRLKQENEELKGRCQKLSEDLSCSNGCLRNKIDIEIIYRSALEEIKNIITQEVVTNNKKLRAILDKINEVLG